MGPGLGDVHGLGVAPQAQATREELLAAAQMARRRGGRRELRSCPHGSKAMAFGVVGSGSGDSSAV